MKKEFKLDRGEPMRIFGTKCDEQELVGDLTHGYLWLGGANGPCFATVDGRELRKLYGYLKLQFERKKKPHGRKRQR